MSPSAESGLSVVRNLVAISELLYNHRSPCLDFSSNSIATRVSMRRVVASRLEDNVCVISLADCGTDAERSLSKILNSHAANSTLDTRKPSSNLINFSGIGEGNWVVFLSPISFLQSEHRLRWESVWSQRILSGAHSDVAIQYNNAEHSSYL